MNLGTMEQRTEGMKRQAQELIDQAYQRGFKAGQENALAVDSDKFREQGRNEAWEAFKTIHKFAPYCFLDCFPNGNDELYSLSIHEVIRRVHEYEKKKQEEDEEIKVGDEVLFNGHEKALVLRTITRGLMNNCFILCSDGSGGECDKLRLKKTGRHFDVITEVLKKMQEDKE